MKKKICLLFIILFLSCNTSVNALPSSNALGSGVKNVFLYFLTPEAEGLTDQEKKDFKSLMLYCPDDNCNAYSDNTFMDTFLLLTASAFSNKYCKANSQGDCIYSQSGIHYIDTDGNKPGYEEYKNQVRRMLNNLNTVASESGKTINVILAVARGRLANIDQEDIFDYVKNMTIDLYEIYEDVNPSNLRLIGFYWANEAIDRTETVKDTYAVENWNQWVHKMGDYASRTELDGNVYKTLWIPYMDTGARQNNGYSYGFDFVSLQSSQYFRDFYESTTYYSHISDTPYNSFDSCSAAGNDPICRLKLSDAIAKNKGFSVEVEYDYSLYKSAKKYSKYMQWLSYAVDSNNKWNNSINTYYAESLTMIHKQGIRGVSNFHRDMYDLTYRFAKQKLDKIEVTNLALGKTYESTTPYSNSESSSGYANSVSGNELTDGMFGSKSEADYGTEWLAFHKDNAVDGKHFVTVDLGRVYNGLNKFIVELQKNEDASIGLPSKIEVYYSKDKATWTKYGELSLINKTDDVRVMGRVFGDPVSARYIKFEMDTGEKNFVFLSEIEIYKIKTIALDDNDGYASAGGDPIKVGLVNEPVGNITISSSNSSVATASIGDDGYLYVSPLAEGSAVITLKENYNNTSTKYTINVGQGVDVPNTLGAKSIFNLTISMICVFLGIGFIIYAKKNANVD